MPASGDEAAYPTATAVTGRDFDAKIPASSVDSNAPPPITADNHPGFVEYHGVSLLEFEPQRALIARGHKQLPGS
jgi:hypothetical protein